MDFSNNFGGFHVEDMPCPEGDANDAETFTNTLAQLILASDDDILMRLLLRGTTAMVKKKVIVLSLFDYKLLTCFFVLFVCNVYEEYFIL